MKYATPAAFRTALDTRLSRQALESGLDVSRLQRQTTYERFLARLFRMTGNTWILKGGYALELRLGGQARATKDLDFHAPAETDLLDTLQAAAEQDLGDYFEFRVEPPRQGQLTGPPEGGERFRITGRLDDRTYAIFPIDVGQGDLLFNALDQVPARIDLTFAGLPKETFPIYPMAEHFAEKLHAYTRPRASGENTRVKDLLDMSLLLSDPSFPPPQRVVRTARQIFEHYATHAFPDELPLPPRAWQNIYREMAQELQHPVTDMDTAAELIRDFLESVLAS